MRLAIAVAVLASIAALLVAWNLPIVLHFYDLAFPKPGLYEPILGAPFDFWKEANSVVLPLDCRWNRRIYEIAIAVPPALADSRAERQPEWPDLAGSFLVTIMRDGQSVLERRFTGRAQYVRRIVDVGEPFEIYSLSDFPLRRCDGASLRLEVLKPATKLSSLRGNARIMVRVSPEI